MADRIGHSICKEMTIWWGWGEHVYDSVILFLWPICQTRTRGGAFKRYQIHIAQLYYILPLNDIGPWNSNLIHKPLILSPPLQPAGSAKKCDIILAGRDIETQTEIGGWVFSIWVWLPGWGGMAGQFTFPSGLNSHSPYSTDEYFIRSDSIKSAALDDTRMYCLQSKPHKSCYIQFMGTFFYFAIIWEGFE